MSAMLAGKAIVSGAHVPGERRCRDTVCVGYQDVWQELCLLAKVCDMVVCMFLLAHGYV